MQVLTSQGTQEWYTPLNVIEMARAVLGGIDLDPASNETAQGWIKAETYYTADSFPDGLAAPWHGRLWLNPPFDNSPAWCNRLWEEYSAGNVSAAVLLVNSAHGYNWYESLWRRVPVVCLKERLRFVTPDGRQAGQAKKGQTVAYFGRDVIRFRDVFGPMGKFILPG